MSSGMFHFRAALDLMGQDWGGPPGHAEGAWDAMVRRVRRANGTSIISHEILAPGRPRARRPAQGATSRPTTARSTSSTPPATSPARRRPAGRRASSRAGGGSTAATSRASADGRPWFARAFDLPTRAHHLGQRAPARARPRRHRAAGATRRRRARPALAPVLPRLRDRARVGARGQRAHQRLPRQRRDPGAARPQRAHRPQHPQQPRVRRADPRHARRRDARRARRRAPILLPPKFHDWARERGEAWVEWLEQSGVDVVGDPADLAARAAARGPEVPAPRPGLATRPSSAPPSTPSRR